MHPLVDLHGERGRRVPREEGQDPRRGTPSGPRSVRIPGLRPSVELAMSGPDVMALTVVGSISVASPLLLMVASWSASCSSVTIWA
jgi:hypothetical protein